MQKITHFFWICSGADISTLQQCKTDWSKYAGIGATIFFTGLFAAISCGYALYTVFDNLWTSIGLAIVWGLMIFNLDRFIVSSMRKTKKPVNEFLLALPRLILAVIISIVIAKPLELKIFSKEIEPELIVMEQQKFGEQETQIKSRFQPAIDSIKLEIEAVEKAITIRRNKRDELVKLAQEEADGTGGSKQRNAGPIYKIKKLNADNAEAELQRYKAESDLLIRKLRQKEGYYDSLMRSSIGNLKYGKINGIAARIEALDRISAKSSAIEFAHIFIMLLFIAIEIAPVLVKLLSPRGPYDSLIKVKEHGFYADEIQSVGQKTAEVKGASMNLPDQEKSFINDRLNTALENS